MTQADPATAGRRSLATPTRGERVTPCPTCLWHDALAELGVHNAGYSRPVDVAKLRADHVAECLAPAGAG